MELKTETKFRIGDRVLAIKDSGLYQWSIVGIDGHMIRTADDTISTITYTCSPIASDGSVISNYKEVFREDKIYWQVCDVIISDGENLFI